MSTVAQATQYTRNKRNSSIYHNSYTGLKSTILGIANLSLKILQNFKIYRAKNICIFFYPSTQCDSRGTNDDGSLAYKEKEVPVSVVAASYSMLGTILLLLLHTYYIAGEDDEEKLGLYQKVACEEH